MTTLTRTTISEMTAFDAGEQFANEDQVSSYFTLATMREIFGDGADERALALTLYSEEEVPEAGDQEAEAATIALQRMARVVLANGWHCAWVRAKPRRRK